MDTAKEPVPAVSKLPKVGILRTIKAFPRQIWIVLLLHVLDGISYYAISINLTVFLSQEFEQTDSQAGYHYAVWGILLVVFGVPGGFIIDKIGLKKSMVTGSMINVIGRLVFATSDNLTFVLFNLFITISVGSALFGPSLHIVVDRYTKNDESVGTIAFALLYAASNLGAIFAMVGTDILRGVTWYYSSYRLLFLLGAFSNVVALMVTLMYHEHGPSIAEDHSHKITAKRCLGTMKEKHFWVLIAVTIFLIPVRAIFRHMDTIMPKYLLRVYESAPYGTILATNPLLIVPFSIIVGIITKNWTNIYLMIIIGSVICALAPMISWLWYDTTTYIPVIVAMVVFTIGEAIYSPKTTQYVLRMSPIGKKGIYGALITIPTFSGNAFSGIISGVLLTRYCPNSEEIRECNVIWFWISMSALVSPLLLLIFYRLLRRVTYPSLDDSEQAEWHVLDEPVSGEEEEEEDEASLLQHNIELLQEDDDEYESDAEVEDGSSVIDLDNDHISFSEASSSDKEPKDFKQD